MSIYHFVKGDVIVLNDFIAGVQERFGVNAIVFVGGLPDFLHDGM
jgi:hypothetical protein